LDRVINGTREIYDFEIKGISKVLGVSFDELFKE
jgi:hypothetical protein